MDDAASPILIKVIPPPPDDIHEIKDRRHQELKTGPGPPPLMGLAKEPNDEMFTNVLGEALDATPLLTGEKLAKLEKQLMDIAMKRALGSLPEPLQPTIPVTEGLDLPAISADWDAERMPSRTRPPKAQDVQFSKEQWPHRSAVTPKGFDEILEHYLCARRGGLLDEAPSGTHTPTSWKPPTPEILRSEEDPDSHLTDTAAPSSLCFNSMCNTYLRFPHIVVQELTDMILRSQYPTLPSFTTWMLKSGLQTPFQAHERFTPTAVDIETGLEDKRCEARMPLEPSICTMWGSLLNGGTAGNSLNIFCQLVDCNGKYLDAQSLQEQPLVPFAWIVGLPYGVPISHFSPSMETPPAELVQLQHDGQRPGLYWTKLAFRKAGVYAVAAVGFPREACESGFLKSLICSPVTLLGSGFSAFQIVHSSAFAPNCFIAGPGGQPIDYLEASPDTEESVILVTADQFGNLCTRGDNSVAAVGLGALHVLDVVNRHNGEFDLRFIVTSPSRTTPAGLNIFVNKLALDTLPCTILCSSLQTEPKSFFARFDNVQHSLRDRQIHARRTPLPILPTVAPFPCLQTAQRVLPPNYVSLLIPATLEHMSRLEKRLLNAYHEVVAARTPTNERLHALVDTVKSTRKKLEHYAGENFLARADVDRTQKHLRHMDHLISENLLDVLPVQLDFGDLDKLENDLQEKRKKLQEEQREMETRVEKMKTREAGFLEKRAEITQSISTALLTREQSLNNQSIYLAYLLKKIRNKNLMTIKRQLRREQCDASAADAVVALEAEKMRKDLYAKLDKTRLLMKPTAERHLQARSPQLASKPSTPKTLQLGPRHVEVIPDNPTTPAFWIAEGRFRSPLLDAKRKDDAKQHQPFTDDATPHQRQAPSTVAYVEQFGLHSFLHSPLRPPSVNETLKPSGPPKTNDPKVTPTEHSPDSLHHHHPAFDDPPLLFPPMQPPLPSLPPRRVRRPHSELRFSNADEASSSSTGLTGDSFY